MEIFNLGIVVSKAMLSHSLPTATAPSIPILHSSCLDPRSDSMIPPLLELLLWPQLVRVPALLLATYIQTDTYMSVYFDSIVDWTLEI